MGTPPCDKLSFGGPMARAGWVAEVGNLYPFCSQYYTQHCFQKQFALILAVAKVTLKPKVVHTEGGGRTEMECLRVNRNGTKCTWARVPWI